MVGSVSRIRPMLELGRLPDGYTADKGRDPWSKLPRLFLVND